MTRRGAAGSRLYPVIDEERGVTRGVTFTGICPAVLLHAGGDRARRRFRSSVCGIGSLPARAQRNLAQRCRHSDAARNCPKSVGHRSAWQGRWQVSRRRQTGSAPVKALQDSETAMAYGLRAGNHCSGSVSLTAWTSSVRKRAVSGRRTLVGLLIDRSDGAARARCGAHATTQPYLAARGPAYGDQRDCCVCTCDGLNEKQTPIATPRLTRPQFGDRQLHQRPSLAAGSAHMPGPARPPRRARARSRRPRRLRCSASSLIP